MARSFYSLVKDSVTLARDKRVFYRRPSPKPAEFRLFFKIFDESRLDRQDACAAARFG